jgi:hypothetical protein
VVSVSQSSPFNLLLRLFKYDDVLGELDEVGQSFTQRGVIVYKM